MADRTCETCRHSANMLMTEWVPKRHDLRCMRIGVTRDGKPDFHYNVGRSCSFETDSLPEPQRAAGEKCSPARLHWEAKPDAA